MVSVLIDGASQGKFDLSRATQHWKSGITFGGLDAGTYTIEAHPLGTKNAASTGSKTVVDAFQGPIVQSGPTARAGASDVRDAGNAWLLRLPFGAIGLGALRVRRRE